MCDPVRLDWNNQDPKSNSVRSRAVKKSAKKKIKKIKKIPFGWQLAYMTNNCGWERHTASFALHDWNKQLKQHLQMDTRSGGNTSPAHKCALNRRKAANYIRGTENTDEAGNVWEDSLTLGLRWMHVHSGTVWLHVSSELRHQHQLVAFSERSTAQLRRTAGVVRPMSAWWFMHDGAI